MIAEAGLAALWLAAGLAVLQLVLMVLSRTSLGGLWRPREPALRLGRYRATPYAACLAVPAAVWLLYLAATGGVR